MKEVRFTINSKEVACKEGELLLKAAQRVGVYVPSLCFHPAVDSTIDIEPSEVIYRGSTGIKGEGVNSELEGCGLCIVAIEGKGIVQACHTAVHEGMVVNTNTPEVQTQRQERLAEILQHHPHECLICDQGEGCTPFQANCPRNVPLNERCCPQHGKCELEKIVKYVGIKSGIGRFVYPELPIVSDNPLFEHNYNLCVGCLRCIRVCKETVGAGALGFVHKDNNVVVGTVGPSLQESGCRFCGCCVEVCPTGAVSDRELSGVKKKEILVPCRTDCPLEIDIPRYINYISRGEFQKALAVISEKTPFAALLGRVCPHPCQDNCRRGKFDDSIAICDLKRFLADEAEKEVLTERKGAAGKVAVIGSGPAGLTAAYFLALGGYGVTVFERLSALGGMLRTGIPEYRLPREVLDREIDSVKRLGVEFKTNTALGDTLTIDDLFDKGYGAVFIGSGAYKDLKLNIQGEERPEVIPGVVFLGRINSGELTWIGERVAIVGGGNAAVDAARSALRVGAKQVTILYRRTRQEMPANDHEIEEALEEGVNIRYLVAPTEIIPGKQTGVEVQCTEMQLGDYDKTGRRRPIAVDGSTFVLEVDTVISAIGQVPELSLLTQLWELK